LYNTFIEDPVFFTLFHLYGMPISPACSSIVLPDVHCRISLPAHAQCMCAPPPPHTYTHMHSFKEILVALSLNLHSEFQHALPDKTVGIIIIIIIIITITTTTIIIIIIIIIYFMQGIHTSVPETNHVSRVYSVAAILRLLFMVHVTLSSILNSFVLLQ
jgi:hypothetical protein